MSSADKMDPLAFDENAIRSDDLMAESDRLHAEDLCRLLERRGEFVHADCPACGECVTEPMWERDGFSFVCCQRCATGYLSPRPPPGVLEWHYRSSKSHVFWAEHIFPASEASRRTLIARPRVERLIQICERQSIEPGGALIEVGAGFGTFCAEAKSSGWFKHVMAIEPTPSNAKACRERGIDVLEVQVENAALQVGTADVVATFEVLEHLYSPADFVHGCVATLKPGGLLVLSCPNLKGFELATLGPLSRTVDPEHLNYFHPKSLQLLLDRCGMEVLEVLTPGVLDADIVRKRAKVGLVDLGNQPFLKQVLLDDWELFGAPFQRFLADNRLSSHMWAVARKPV